MQFCCMQCLFCCARLYNFIFYAKMPNRKKSVSSAHLPWMWIGAELPDGSIRSLTEIVDISIEYGDCVTPKFLETISGITNAKRWFYLNSKTFKEEEIPADGLIIEDDPNE